MRVFLDANVLFTAAHNAHGKASLVIDLADEGHWEVVTSALCLEEASHNLERKFPKALERLRYIIKTMRVLPDAPEERCPIALPAKDRHVFAAALRGGANRLLTGDRRHFGPFMNRPQKTGGVVVQTVADFLDDVAG